MSRILSLLQNLTSDVPKHTCPNPTTIHIRCIIYIANIDSIIHFNVIVKATQILMQKVEACENLPTSTLTKNKHIPP